MTEKSVNASPWTAPRDAYPYLLPLLRHWISENTFSVKRIFE